MSLASVETISAPALEIIEPLPAYAPIQPLESVQKFSKQGVRTSLKASTLDGVFAAIQTSITSGVLLTNFLLRLGANPVEVGMLASIPMLVNVLQPLGAYIAERTTSRHIYGLWIFGFARLLWLFLTLGIWCISWSSTNSHQLITWTLGMVFFTNILQALGASSWFSWMAALVPHRLRGRYFGFRNSAVSLTTLIVVPLLGFIISAWPSGTINGYGFVVLLGVIAGLVSLSCQFFMVDVNPQLPTATVATSKQERSIDLAPTALNSQSTKVNIFKDSNFLRFLVYFGVWAFAVNLSTPFFNLYLLDNLKLDLNWVTLYTSLMAAANLVMLVLWGKLADRLGNRPILLLVGILAAVTPFFWLGAGTDLLSRWLWLPLIHILIGGSFAAIDLCNNNIQMEVAPVEHPSAYFAIAAAVAGVCGALGTTVGSELAQLAYIAGLPGLFALSAVVRLIALLPLIFVKEPRSQSVMHILQNIFGSKQRSELVQAVGITNSTP